MINVDNLKEAKEIIRKEIGNNLNMTGKKDFGLLCEVSGQLDLIINRLTNPNKWKSIDRELDRI